MTLRAPPVGHGRSITRSAQVLSKGLSSTREATGEPEFTACRGDDGERRLGGFGTACDLVERPDRPQASGAVCAASNPAEGAASRSREPMSSGPASADRIISLHRQLVRVGRGPADPGRLGQSFAPN